MCMLKKLCVFPVVQLTLLAVSTSMTALSFLVVDVCRLGSAQDTDIVLHFSLFHYHPHLAPKEWYLKLKREYELR
jgi:hypothetical protein